ncbi:MAG: hypothetical protein AAGL17_16515, partial [Cyanobacteria bacterium J06576_12]
DGFSARVKQIARFRGIGSKRVTSLRTDYERIARVIPEILGSRRSAKLLLASVSLSRIDWGNSQR